MQKVTDKEAFDQFIELTDLRDKIFNIFRKHRLWKSLKTVFAKDGVVPELLDVYVGQKNYTTDPPEESDCFRITMLVDNREINITLPLDMLFNFSKKQFDSWFAKYNKEKEISELRCFIFDNFNLAKRVLD